MIFAKDKNSIEEDTNDTENFNERRGKIADNIYDKFYGVSPENSNYQQTKVELMTEYTKTLNRMEKDLVIESSIPKHKNGEGTGWVYYGTTFDGFANDKLGRLYFNIEPLQAPALLKAVTQEVLKKKKIHRLLLVGA